MGHFSIDVGPESIRSAETRLAELGEQLDEEGGKLAAVPDQATDWTGRHAVTLKRATTLVAQDMVAGAPNLEEAASALRTFRGVCERVRDAIPGLNSRWTETVTAYGLAEGRADGDYDRSRTDTPPQVWRAEQSSFAAAKNRAMSAARDTRDREQGRLTGEYDGLVADLERAATACGNALARAVPSPVSEETAATYARTGVLPGLDKGEFSPADYLRGKRPLERDVTDVVDDLVTRGVLPPEVKGMTADELDEYLLAHPDVARDLVDNRPYGGDPGSAESFLYSLTLPQLSSPGADTAGLNRDAARRFFESLSTEEQRLLAMVYPSVVGNLPGVPFEARATANRVKVVVALDDERTRLPGLEEQDRENENDWDFLGLNNNDLDGAITDAKRRTELYESILGDDRQIILFDPSEDGAIAELHGTIDENTQNVGVLVPGTGANLGKFDGDAARSRSFVAANRPGDLAMITWMGGDLPDGVVADAPFNHYASDLAPGLAGFSHELRQEIEHSPAGDARTTFAGHSYGGSVVGTSEKYGLDADRVLHIESAGMGSGVDDDDDLHPTQPDVRRYSMTAEQDFIGVTQGAGAGDGIGHGADPDDFPGSTRLDTGNFADGSLIDGTFDSHSDVFTPRSDAWRNMYDVFTGGEVRLYRPPEYAPGPRGSRGPQVPYSTPAEEVDIP